MGARTDAIAKGESKYDPGKPCREGHTSLRYSTNGACVECLRLQAESRYRELRVAKIKKNKARANGAVGQKIFARLEDRPSIQELLEIFQYSSIDVIDNVKGFIRAIHDSCPAPHTLTRDDLLEFISFRDGNIYNRVELEFNRPDQYSDEPNCLLRNGSMYVWGEVVECLHMARVNVKPYVRANSMVEIKKWVNT